VLLSHTGYSGELGYELFAPCERATEIWKAIAQTAEPGELTPYGFKALDVLRIESALVFCGYEMDAANTPYDVGLGWTVDLDKESFIGRAALAWAKQQGSHETLVGLEVEDVYFPESGAKLFRDGRKVGIVTSPTFSPLMEKVIALAGVKPEHTSPGTELQVEMGSRARTAWVVRIPFYDPSKRRVIIQDSPEQRSFSHRDTEYTEQKPRWHSRLFSSKRRKHRFIERHLNTSVPSVPLWQVWEFLR